MIPKKLLDEITKWINEGRYGRIEINFSGGKIVNYNVTQSLRIEFTSSNPDTKITASSSTIGEILQG